MTKILNKLFKVRFFPLILKIITLGFFGILMAIGFTESESDPVLLKQLRNTNIANLFVWSYWWPLIIIASVLFGRVWCMICPVELVTSLAAKLGLKKKRPKFLKSGWVITLFYMFILIVGINIFAIHRNPTYMAIYLIAIMGIAIITGLIYKKNTFCRYICPVGHILGLYARVSPWGWRVKTPKTCKTCKDKSCISENNLYLLNNKSCGVDLYPSKIKDNSHCILCGGCLKACDTGNSAKIDERPNPGFIKVGIGDGLINGAPLVIAEWFFLFIVSGFVISEFIEEYSVAEPVLSYIPHHIMAIFSISGKVGKSLISSAYLFFFLPSIFWFIPYIIVRIFGTAISIKNYVTYFGLAFIPVVASVHFSKAIIKTSSRIPYWKYLLSDYRGMETAKAIVSKDIILAKLPLWAEWTITFIVTAVFVGGFILSIRTIGKLIKRLQLKDKYNGLKVITTAYFLIFFVDLILWRWIQY